MASIVRLQSPDHRAQVLPPCMCCLLPFVRVVRKCLIPKPSDFEPKSLGYHIKRERLKQGLLQKGLASLFKVDAFTILNWETAITKPQIKHIPALIQFLGYNPEPP